MMGVQTGNPPEIEAETDEEIDGYIVAEASHNGRRYASAGETAKQARGRLANKLVSLFAEVKAPLLNEHTSRLIETDLAGCHYVEMCYNGEELTEENLDFDLEVVDNLWPESWREETRDEMSL